MQGPPYARRSQRQMGSSTLPSSICHLRRQTLSPIPRQLPLDGGAKTVARRGKGREVESRIGPKGQAGQNLNRCRVPRLDPLLRGGARGGV